MTSTASGGPARPVRLVEIHPEAVDAIARELALDIIQDARFLIRDSKR
jgi:hypothetical protein